MKITIDEAAWNRALKAYHEPRPERAEPKTALDAILDDDLDESEPVGFVLKPVPPPYIPIRPESNPGELKRWVEQSVQVVPKTLPRLVRERPLGVTEPQLRKVLQEGIERGWWVLDPDMRIGAAPLVLNF